MPLLQDHRSICSVEAEDDSKSVEEDSSTMDPSGHADSERGKEGTGTSPKKTATFERTVARKEDKAVFRSKTLVLIVMLAVAASFATATYFFMKNGEKRVLISQEVSKLGSKSRYETHDKKQIRANVHIL